MVISLCARSYANRIFPRNSNIVFLMKKGEDFREYEKKRGIYQEKGKHRKKGEDCAPCLRLLF